MLHVITTASEEIEQLIKDDPVRPEIPMADRVNDNSRIYLLRNANQIQAITCVKFLDLVPTAVNELVDSADILTTAVFYTIWSYASGSGRTLIDETRRSIAQEFPSITTFVTLSPKTEMARRFHLRNGADVYRENLDTINYIYK